MWKCIVLSVCLCAWAEAGGETKLVNTAQGDVLGYKDPEHDIYAFRGVPYAKAPTGPDKFKAPLPPPVRQKTLDAKESNVICPQAEIPWPFETNFSQLEDCLIANIYIPDTEEENLPVVVYVHGGAYQVGWGTYIVPKKLIVEHKVILVNFNYRLGIHGFLCLGTEDVPGNAGMKDQLALLRWVKNNIGNFGGNPDDVTIAGYSAGSASVQLLMLSKAAEGLFNKVIHESGSSAAAFSVQPDPLENAKWFAKVNNFYNYDDIYALENFYKTASYAVLTKDAFFDRADSTFVFSPCVERASKEAFLVESPINILTAENYRKVPVLHGFTNMDGALRLPYYDSWRDRMHEKFSDFLPADLKFESEEQKDEVAQSVKHFYFGDGPLRNESILQFVEYFTDVIFAYPALRGIKLMVENGQDDIYLYEYSFVDDNTPKMLYTEIKGAPHCAQSWAMAEASFLLIDPSKYSDDFKNISSKLRQIWANFIKTGRPVPPGSGGLPAWPAVRADWAPHMSLDRALRLRGSLLPQRARFWEDIYIKHYRQPIAPPKPRPPREDF